jgi:glycosyltransferase involved in cell wall biosynthesis
LAGVVARLVDQKGHAYLLDAFQRVIRELPTARLLVVGDGPLRQKLEAQVATEGFGLVALEAMAQAKPIVATRVSALPEVIVDDQTGWLVPPRDPGALADALLHALRQPELAKAHGQRGYRRLNEHFSPDKLADQTLAVYDQVLTERNAA